jgi:hypothetical protein
MQQAQAALDAARAAGADQYAHDEFAAAVDALKRAQDASSDGDYRLALNNALDSRERAENAAKLAATERESARTDAERALSTLVAAVASTQTRLKSAEAARVPSTSLRNPRRAVGDAERRVQEARSAVEKGDYAAAKKAAAEGMTRLDAAAHDLERASTASTRPRR